MLSNQRSKLLGGGVRITLPAWATAGGGPTPIACYQPKGAASLAVSYLNLAGNAAYNAAPGVAPTFATATGWAFNGSTQYLATGVVPVSADWTYIVRALAANGDSGGGLLGAGLATGIVRAGFVGGAWFLINGGASSVTISGNPPVVLAMAGKNPYVNGVASTTLAAGTAMPTVQLYIGARNNNGTAANFHACTIAALAIYSATLTAPQVAAVTAAMQAL